MLIFKIIRIEFDEMEINMIHLLLINGNLKVAEFKEM